MAQTSFPEQAVYFYAKQLFPDALSRYKAFPNSKLELDIFIPSLSIGIEYDGKYYHGFEDSKIREKKKFELCLKHHIKLIRIKEGEPIEWFNEAANETHYIKVRIKDDQLNAFLYNFFFRLTTFTRKTLYLPISINIKRDRNKIMEYLADVSKSFGKLYPDLAKNWDKETNGKLTPFMFTPGSNHKATFVCERCGRKFTCEIVNAVKWKRKLCKKCSMSENGLNCTKRIVEERGSLADFFPEVINEWDNKKNGAITPNSIPPHYKNKVYWKCQKCGYEWFQSPAGRIHHDILSKCPHCAGRVAMKGVDDLETLYPDIAKEWDYERNGNVLPSQIRPRSSQLRYWICSKHGTSFKAAPANRVRGCGCIKCKGEKIINKAGFKVEQYSKDLKYIRTYNSLNEVGRILDMSPEAIRQAILKGALSANCYWKYQGTEFTTLRPDKKHAVIGTNLKTGEVIEFESAREAERKLGIGHSKIMNVCNKKPKYNSAGGYKWEFKK